MTQNVVYISFYYLCLRLLLSFFLVIIIISHLVLFHFITTYISRLPELLFLNTNLILSLCFLQKFWQYPITQNETVSIMGNKVFHYLATSHLSKKASSSTSSFSASSHTYCIPTKLVFLFKNALWNTLPVFVHLIKLFLSPGIPFLFSCFISNTHANFAHNVELLFPSARIYSVLGSSFISVLWYTLTLGSTLCRHSVFLWISTLKKIRLFKGVKKIIYNILNSAHGSRGLGMVKNFVLA